MVPYVNIYSFFVVQTCTQDFVKREEVIGFAFLKR